MSQHHDQPGTDYFDVMAAHARSHWWYEGRRHLVGQLLAGRLDGVLVDVGCGTGDNLGMLRQEANGPVVGTDLSEYALRRAGRGVAVALAGQLPFADASAAAVTSMDVVEHLDDDIAGLVEYRRVLRPGGTLLLTVPAYQSLWSEHDVRAAHRRRYSRATLVAAVHEAGFVVERTSYYNAFLVPPAVLLRKTPLRRLVRATDEEVGASSAFVTRVMAALTRAERAWLTTRALPFGLSIVLVGHRPHAG